MEKAIIYGCGKIGKLVYESCKERFDILFFVDQNAERIKEYDGIPVYIPQKIKEYLDVKILIAVADYRDVLKDIECMEIANRNIEVFRLSFMPVLSKVIAAELDKRTIRLGEWFYKSTNLDCKELTFIPGGSAILDYMFLKEVAIKSGSRVYLEVGTYIGESINILTDCCEKLYSVTLPIEDAKRQFGLSRNVNFIGQLAKNQKITSYYMDSRQFDFSKHADTVDLYFIDGDHSYEGVYSDTRNIFKNKRDDAIVVWHDFKYTDAQYKPAVINAVYDVLGSEFANVYVTDNNACGIYIPPKRMNEFEFAMHECQCGENETLYTYDVTLKAGGDCINKLK